jgi:long-chain acyl-CoA synthetase
MLSYTSGTTGDPKGVMLTHKMMMNAVGASLISNPIYKGEAYISYLPLAHSYEQYIFAAGAATGGRIGFYSGDVLKLVSIDIPALKPEIFPSVPRIYNRIYGKI